MWVAGTICLVDSLYVTLYAQSICRKGRKAREKFFYISLWSQCTL